MSITYHERPGVYVEYDTTSRSATSAARIVGIAARGTGTGLHSFTSPENAAVVYPQTTILGKMAALAFAGGAARVICCPVSAATSAAYTSAVSLLLTQGGVGCLAVDTEDIATLAGIGAIACAEDTRACICFAGLTNPTIGQLTATARDINSERLVLLGSDVRMAGSSDFGGGCLAAAAMAGLVSCQSDPALPLNGAQLPGLDAVRTTLSEAQIDTLVRAGVTPLEAVGTQVHIIRAVTTRTTTDDIPDNTWHELSTICIFDDVIPAVRNALAAKFLRRKNTAVTRNAIRAQTAIVLEDRVRREIIESYDSLQVEPLAGDPTGCEVRFSFAVVQGLCRIHLRVHILV